MPRAALYLRQSLDRTGEGAAVDRQREACLSLAETRGYEVVAEYVDNSVSASSAKPRPAYTRMVADVKAGKVDVIVAWHVDRLTRKLTDLEDLIDLSAKAGLTIATVTGDLDLSTDTGRLLGRILASVARGEVERKGARQKAAAAQRSAQGKPPTGPRGFGYSPDGTEIVEEEAAVIRKAYDLMLASGSVRSVVRLLNDSGFTTNRGNEWKTYAVRSLLMNPRYAALTWAPGPRDHREITGRGNWPAIVEEETWRAVNDLLSNPSRKTVTSTRRAYLLSGLALCGKCGAPLGAGGNSRGVRVYRCKASAHLARRQDEVEQYVTAAVLHRLTEPSAGRLLDDNDRPDAALLRSQALAKRQSLDNLVALVADGTLSAAQARPMMEKVKAEIAETEERLVHAGRGDVLGPLVHAAKIEEAWDGLDLDSRRAVIRAVFDEVVVGAPGRGSRAFDPESVSLVVTVDGRRVRYAPPV